MYIILSRKRKNLGDTLILERFKSLLGHFRPDIKQEFLDGHLPLDQQKDINFINSAKAIIMYGGPGYRKNLYPGIYPLIKEMDLIKTPIHIGGMGANVFPADDYGIERYKFDSPSLKLLQRVSETTPFLGSRDFITQQILLRHGIKNVRMTGCPAWYDLESLGKEFVPPREIKNIVFTTPAGIKFFPQAKAVLDSLVRQFPHSRIIVSFHKGFEPNEFLTPQEVEVNRELARFSMEKKCEVVDTSLDLKKIDFYNDMDIHVGYRVHGHIWFMSKRKASILIAEDSRGKGVISALNTPGILGFHEPSSSLELFKVIKLIPDNITSKLIKKNMIREKGVDKEVVELLRQEIESGFSRFIGLGKRIDNYFEKGMKPFIMNLP